MQLKKHLAIKFKQKKSKTFSRTKLKTKIIHPVLFILRYIVSNISLMAMLTRRPDNMYLNAPLQPTGEQSGWETHQKGVTPIGLGKEGGRGGGEVSSRNYRQLKLGTYWKTWSF